MGMTIDEALSHLNTYSSTMGSGQTTQEQHEDAKRVARDTMRKYQLMQADYNARLKADMVAVLEDLDLQIDESAAYNLEVAKVQRLIRDKIDNLK